MPECSKIRRKKQQVCIGDLDSRITIQNRSIQGIKSTADFSEKFEDSIEAWAMIETAGNLGSGVVLFNGSNIEEVATHNIFIRFDPTVTAESWIEFENEKYNIIKTTDLDNRKEFLILKCNIRGNKDLPVNFS